MKPLDEIRAMIPEGFTCKEGCSECCGPIPISPEEWARITDSRAGRLALRRHLDVHIEERRGSFTVAWVNAGGRLACPFLGPKGCMVYDERPLVCRLFGQLADLKCPEGVIPDADARVSEETNRAFLEYCGLEGKSLEQAVAMSNTASFEV